MVDLETLGTKPGSAILSLGAVVFDKNGPTGSVFYCAIELQSCVAVGLTIDPKTIGWWMGQSAEAREVFRDPDSYPLFGALESFEDFCVQHSDDLKNLEIWGNGANFDNSLLGAAYDACGLTPPWMFWNDRCYRTLKAMYPHIQMTERTGTHHNALDDAISQARHLVQLPVMQQLFALEEGEDVCG